MSSAGTRVYSKSLYIPTVKMDLPYEVSLWLNFAVSNSHTLTGALSFSLKHIHSARAGSANFSLGFDH